MNFAIITDIHLGPESFFKGILRKVNKEVKVFLADFVVEMNNVVKPEFVVVLGDLIEDDNEINDKNNIDYIVRLFAKLECPVYYVAGNHDLKNISEEDLAKRFKQEKLYYSFDSGNFHFIVLFSKKEADKNIWVSDEQIKWLGLELEQTDKKTIIFSHHVLADQDLKGNLWFEGREDLTLIANRKEIRNILTESKKVMAVFNSHMHWDKQDIHDDIPYFTIQSLTENEDNKGVASETHAVVNIGDDKVKVEIKGKYPKVFLYEK